MEIKFNDERTRPPPIVARIRNGNGFIRWHILIINQIVVIHIQANIKPLPYIKKLFIIILN